MDGVYYMVYIHVCNVYLRVRKSFLHLPYFTFHSRHTLEIEPRPNTYPQEKSIEAGGGVVGTPPLMTIF
jgi:hypothetical protein